MFKKHSFQVKMVKDPESTYDTTIGDTTDAIGEMIAECARPVAIAVVFVLVAHTISEIVLHTAKTYIK